LGRYCSGSTPREARGDRTYEDIEKYFAFFQIGLKNVLVYKWDIFTSAFFRMVSCCSARVWATSSVCSLATDWRTACSATSCSRPRAAASPRAAARICRDCDGGMLRSSAPWIKRMGTWVEAAAAAGETWPSFRP